MGEANHGPREDAGDRVAEKRFCLSEQAPRDLVVRLPEQAHAQGGGGDDAEPAAPRWKLLRPLGLERRNAGESVLSWPHRATSRSARQRLL